MVMSMKKFEYDITKHPSGGFQKLAYFCTAEGECMIDQLPADQAGILKDILNEKGSLGWELVQLSFGKDGLLAFWKREISATAH
jgi:hypothetical protein